MSYVLYVIMQAILVGFVMVASNPSPYYAALGLVVVSGAGGVLMVSSGGVFLSLVLFLIYLGGMLVVFAYSSALASELYPEAWGSPRVFINMLGYGGFVLVGFWVLDVPFGGVSGSVAEGLCMLQGEGGGVGSIYFWGGLVLMLCGWVLLLTLFVVLEVVRGISRGAIRVVG